MKKIIIVEKREVVAEELLKVVKVGSYKVEVVKTNADAFLYYDIGQTKAIVLENNYDGLCRILQRIRLEDRETAIFVKGQPKAEGEIETVLGEGATIISLIFLHGNCKLICRLGSGMPTVRRKKNIY